MKKMLIIAVIACALFATPVMAKEGFYIGGFIPTESISIDGAPSIDSGSGWGLRAGVGLNRYLSIEGNYAVTKHDIPGGSSIDLKGLAGDVKLSFPLTSLDSAQVMTLEPYILLGYGHYEFDQSDSVKGNGFQYGIGIELYLFRELSIEAGWTRTDVKFKDGVERDGDVKRVDFGIIYHFI